MGESIGMMEGAYFVGRAEILDWINALTGLGYTKIEQCASGAATCQVFDALFPGKVRLEKVNFNARREYEFIHNYKVLQAAFNRLKITKHIDVERLIRAKYQDNLEFMQWVKGYFDSHANQDAANYDGSARRAALGKPDAAPAGRRPLRSSGLPARTGPTRAMATGRPAPVQPRARKVPAAVVAKENRQAMSRGEPVVKKSEYEALEGKLEKCENLLREAENERDFFFNKLQEVENLVQQVEEHCKKEDLTDLMAEFIQLVKRLLYEQEDGNYHSGAEDEPNHVDGVDEDQLAAEVGDPNEAEYDPQYDQELDPVDMHAKEMPAGEEPAADGERDELYLQNDILDRHDDATGLEQGIGGLGVSAKNS